MTRILAAVLAVSMLALAAAGRAAEPTDTVLAYHANAERTGNFVVPALTWERVRSLHEDAGFHADIAGHVYAQPLYWRDSAGAGRLVVATEDDTVYALDAASGRTLWRQSLGQPVRRFLLPCGNIDPLGVTGTPVIDPATQSLYLDAMVLDALSGAPDHEIFALSLADGSIRAGWPVAVASRLARAGQTFTARDQNQRGALAILGDTLYVPYGGHYGDCASYHGWIVGVKLASPDHVLAWHTGAQGGGIWGPAGISSDGASLFVATGNTMDADRWKGGEAVIRLPPSLAFSGAPADYFTPRDWRQLDARDADLGGVAPVLFDLGTARLALALGKDGDAYLLDRGNLGGIAGSLAAAPVSARPIRTAAAEYPAAGGAMVAFAGPGANCPAMRLTPALTVLRIGGTPPAISTAWCAALSGAGAPIVTTIDGEAQPIVWMLGAEGDDRLYGFRGDTGERLFMSESLPGLRHFGTLIAAGNHLYVAADGAVYAFAF